MKPKPTMRIRPPRGADTFVEGGSSDARPAAKTPPSSPRLPGAPKLRGLVARAGGEQKMRLTVYLDEETAVRLRTHCFQNGLEMSAVGAEAIAKAMAKVER